MATIIADSNSRADVQTAVTAASAGDTVIVPTTPSASAEWSTAVEVTKALTISGVGVTLTAGATMTYGFFNLTAFTSDDLMRITGFVFDLVNVSGGTHIYFTTGLALSKLRIDHNTFHHGGYQLEIRGCKGVVDNNSFYNGNTNILFSAGTRSQADASWESMEAGTGDALFVEDNYFTIDSNWTGTPGVHDCVIDTYQGGKLVIRYNEIDGDNLPVDWDSQYFTFTTHGSAAGGTSPAYWQENSAARRGQSVVEVYNNYIHGKYIARLFSARGSANLVHDNVITSDTYSLEDNVVYMYEEEQYETQWSPNRTAWPAEDQVHNTFIWNNTIAGSPQQDSQIGVGATSADYIQKNRDYFTHRPATLGEGMTLGKEVFTGANGATNTYPTDGEYYNTEGSMTFVPDVENAYYGYVPYTYPHPLTEESTSTPWVMIYG